VTALGDRLTPAELTELLNRRAPHNEIAPAVTTPIPAPPPTRSTKHVDLPPHERALLTVAGWNHPCGYGGCPTWVPNHRRRCADHKDLP
jgi:hypothetical protein